MKLVGIVVASIGGGEIDIVLPGGGLGSGIIEIRHGEGIALDLTDPRRPIISATGVPDGAVSEVNGQTGVVSLDAVDVGADPQGSASTAIETHVDDDDPHPEYARRAPFDALAGQVDALAGDIETLAMAFVEHRDDQDGAHGMPAPSTIVTSSNIARMEHVTAYPDPMVAGVLYVLLP
jgi:hypothetical protein